MRSALTVLVLSLLFINNQVTAQNISCPEVVWTTPNPLTLTCDPANSCFQLEAQLPDIRQTVNGPDAYVVNEIPYSGNYGYSLPGATNILVNTDDIFSGKINLPFPFCYYGATYSQIVVGANGRVSFDASLSGNYDEWDIQGQLPSLTNGHTRATIYAPYHDMNPEVSASNKSINWVVIDEEPCRKMIITYRNIPHYECSSLRSTFQVVLYENTNAIEIYIESKPTCTSWNGGRSILGIQNWEGTQATTVQGWNPGTTAVLTPKAYRFTPNGPSLLAGDIDLLDENNNVIQSIPNPGGANGEINVTFPNVCFDLNGPNVQSFKVRATYQACSGNDIEVLDTLTVSKPDLVPEPMVVSPVEYCLNALADELEATALSGHTLHWFDENQNPMPSPITPSTNTIGSTTYYVSQSYQDCESQLVPIEVMIIPDIEEDIIIDLCRSQLPFDTLGQNIPSNQQTDLTTPFATLTHTGMFACDTVVSYYLNIIENDTTDISEVVCENELPYQFYNQNINTAGVYYHTLTGLNTCDSIIVLDLTINSYITNTITATICEGESYVFNGVSYTSPVTFQDNITDTFATAGCDSIVTLVLDVDPIITNTITATICEGESYVFNGVTYTSPVTFQDNITDTFATAGCDSIVTLVLDIDPYITNTITATICEGESYVFNGVFYTSPVTFQDNITDTFATAGCDSIVTLVLDVDPIITNTITATICEGESYVFNGVSYTSPVTFQDNIRDTFATAGCDSIVTLVLDIDPYITNTLTATICEGESYVFNGVSYTSPVTFQDNITDTFATTGCDSIVTLVLNVNPTYYEDEVVTLCESELPYVWNGINVPVGTTTQNAFDSLTYVTTAGCDSVIYLNLEIHETFQIHETISICELDLPFTWHQHTFDTQTGLGTFTETASYQSVQGCDSTYYLTLHIQENFYSTVDTTVCKESLPFVWHGYAFNDEASVAITPEITYYGNSGCDSIVTLQVNLFDDVVITHVSEEACGAVTFEGNTYHQSVSFIDTSYNQAGCDSLIRHVDIVVHPSYTDYEVINLSSCDSVVYHDKTYYSSTQLVEEYTTAMGCDSLVVEVNIDIDHFNLELSASLDTLYKGESVYLETYGSSAYTVLSWAPTSYFPYQNATSQSLTLGESALIEVTAEGVGGCMDTASIYIHYQEINKDVFVPNAFTPDGDGLNDLFGPELPLGQGYEIEDFSIYNRYGERIFFNSGKENKKWDGTLRGQPVDVGVYFYVLVVRFIDGETFEAKGEVHLLR